MHIVAERFIKKREDFLFVDNRYVQRTQLTMRFSVNGKKLLYNTFFDEGEDLDDEGVPTEEAKHRLSVECWKRLEQKLEMMEHAD